LEKAGGRLKGRAARGFGIFL
jgi:hypothetical protein